MTDEEMAAFLGLSPEEEDRAGFVKGLSPEKRALFERMAALETEVALWQDGLGPKPQGVLIDTERSTKRRRGWR
ncbi:hypothetical protein J4G43_022740 [Bradyrhizobium barranii subsp. barranii]|uniref:Uncharacterized protein n=1 Tax=Bradyrhizobium barranii subsp. barranii TaxID=2823807 RepID=A0A939M6I5_9BRAD|nr:hypothetical protein [Bradyrhizobium barranii]UEM16782.1 hypothetical protein J4G43_022740 [Bradyrhizobium barranii subsp. barranii]